MHIFHKWSKWEEYDETGIRSILIKGDPEIKKITYKDIRQKRHCLKCGKIQDILIKG